MLLHEFKEFYSKYANFDVVRDEEGSSVVNIYLLWSCSEEQYMDCLQAGAENVDVRLNEDNSTRDKVEVSVFFEGALVSTETLHVPNENLCSGTVH